MTVRRQQNIEVDVADMAAGNDPAPAEHTSPTRRTLTDAHVAHLVATGLPGAEVQAWEPLHGGQFAAVARVSLRDGRDVVLKVGPAPSTPLLRYEHGMIGAEARYLARVGQSLPDGPMATLLAHGGSPEAADTPNDAAFEGEWMLVSLLPGASLTTYTTTPHASQAADADAPLDSATAPFESADAAGPLDSATAPRECADPSVLLDSADPTASVDPPLDSAVPLDPTAPVREQLGAFLAQVHTLTSPDGRFGYDGGIRPSGATWPEAFTAIIEALLADAAMWNVALPADPDRIRAAVRRNQAVLAQVERPALVHFDLWDGNVLAAPGPDGTLRLTGVVDGERFLYGDPLVDFVSTALGRRIEQEPGHPFVTGYRRARGGVVEGTDRQLTGTGGGFTDSQLRRIALYRMHLALLMVVETPSRGMDAAAFAGRREWTDGMLLDAVAHLDAVDRIVPPQRL